MTTLMIDNILDYKQWGVTARWGIPLYINPTNMKPQNGWACDEEDDENGNFVGLGFSDGTKCLYFSDLELVKQFVFPKCVFHNGKTDLWKLKQWGIHVDSSYILNDTIIASYVSDITAKSHSLKSYAQMLGMPYPKYEEIVGKGKNKKTLDKHDLQLVAEYNACDTVATWKLWEHFKKTMTQKEMEYYNNIEMPVYRLLYKMQEQGVRVNIQELMEYKTKLENELNELSQSFSFQFGKDFNPRSSKQVQDLFKVENSKKETLLKDDREEVKQLLRYKQLYKLVSTYIKPYLEGNGELHPEFNQISYSKETKNEEGIRTGRLSSRNPNFQNLPSHTEEGLKIRKAIIPNKQSIFVLADYSQIELRVLAHFCQDKRMIEAFNNGEDIHEATAKAINASRDIAKTINFAITYGSGAYNLHYKTGIPLVDAQEFMDRFDKQFPSIHDWKNITLYNAKKQGYVRTLLGRQVKYELQPNCKKHGLKTVNKGVPCKDTCKKRIEGETGRRAISAVVQGSAAEIIKLSMLQLDKLGFNFPVQEHDALLFELEKTNDEVSMGYDICTIQNTMESVVELKVPLVVDIKVGDSWGACKTK